MKRPPVLKMVDSAVYGKFGRAVGETLVQRIDFYYELFRRMHGDYSPEMRRHTESYIFVVLALYNALYRHFFNRGDALKLAEEILSSLFSSPEAMVKTALREARPAPLRQLFPGRVINPDFRRISAACARVCRELSFEEAGVLFPFDALPREEKINKGA